MSADTATQVARERADGRLDAALGELRKAAREIGTRFGIPEGIAGHSVEELLGRMAYVPSMARELRRACGQELAKLELREAFDRPAGAEPRALAGAGAAGGSAPPPAGPIVQTSELPANIPVGLDVGDLDGVTANCVRALREHGFHNVGQLVNVPDEHLVKLPGLAEKSVAQIRTAIAKASRPRAGA